MICFLRGKIEKLEPIEVHLDVGGVGYRVHITLADSEKLALQKGESVKLFTRVQYSENSQNIFGFLDDEVAGLYDFLVNLHGIGPKIVMSILSYCPTGDFLAALESGNGAYLTTVPGIGKAKAEKIIFEARSKQKKLEILRARWRAGNPAASGSAEIPRSPGESISLKKDIFSDLLTQSLEGLGFSSKEILLAEKKISSTENNLPDASMENIQKWVRIYLKHL